MADYDLLRLATVLDEATESTLFFQEGGSPKMPFGRNWQACYVQNPKALLLAGGAGDLPGDMGVKKTSLRPGSPKMPFGRNWQACYV